MTVQEFSDGFDTLVSSYANKIAFGQDSSMTNLSFDEYEKSYFLTESEKALVVGLYSGRNPLGLSFEETEELRRYLAPLVAEVTLSPVENSGGMPLGGESRHFFFTLPDGKPSGNSSGISASSRENNSQEEQEEVKPGVWFITYESVNLEEGKGKCASHTMMEVVPVSQDEYHRIRKNPFRGANDRRALRFDLSNGLVEVICKYPVESYYVRYLRKPKPIVLEVMPDGLSVEGEVNPRGCELHEALHQKILEGAVDMAVRSRTAAMPQPAKNKEE